MASFGREQLNFTCTVYRKETHAFLKGERERERERETLKRWVTSWPLLQMNTLLLVFYSTTIVHIFESLVRLAVIARRATPQSGAPEDRVAGILLLLLLMTDLILSR